ncbi:MAG: hypothetical protein HC786_20080 [Richelia sp. CSU_2_1]|nr:hypothetical protein [Richelia sp. CSU_2_1]
MHNCFSHFEGRRKKEEGRRRKTKARCEFNPIGNKLSLDGNCQGYFRRCFKEKAVRPSLSFGERCHN